MISYPMAVITGPGKIEFQDRILREPSADEVVIKVKSAAICGSDLHLYRGRHPSAQLPSAVGHEIAGDVYVVGKDVKQCVVGDRVTIEPVITCGKCESCLRGQYHLCTQISFQYRKGQGGFAPYFIVQEDRVYKLPDNVPYTEGALVEPLSVALHAVKKSGLMLGQSGAVFGAGAIGLLVLMLAQQASGSRIFISDVRPYRLNKATELGAWRVIDSHHEDAVRVILEETQQMGVDHAFEAVGLETTLVQSLNVVKKGGVVTMLGIFEELQAMIPANLFIQREITLSGSQGYSWDFQDSLRLLERGSIDLKPLITHRLPLERLIEGFEILMDPDGAAIKVLVDVGV
jgi:2-desacetyl-2-hydroxyethyl bacteriochlorophyllide A dehydrogenase